MEKDIYTPDQRFDDAMNDWGALEDALKKHPDNEKLKEWVKAARATVEKIIEEIDRDDAKGLGEAALSSSSTPDDAIPVSPDKPTPDGDAPSQVSKLNGAEDLAKKNDEIRYVDSQGFVHRNSQDANNAEVEHWR